MTYRDPRSAALALLVLAPLALFGCTQSATSSTGSTAGSSSSGESGAESAAEVEALSGPECLIGDWYIEQDQMQVFYDALGAANGNLDFTIDGGTGLSFTESSFSYTPEFTLLLTVAGIDGTGTISGAIGGEYTADEAVITTAQETNDTSLTVTVGGVTQDGGALFGSLLAASPIHSAPYECTAQGPLIQFDTGDDRVPVQLTAR
jgi:hypothetical protein